VARLTSELSLTGFRRGKKVRTTISALTAERPRDLVRRRFSRPAADRLWVTGFTYLAIWPCTAYVSVTWNLPVCRRLERAVAG
jgi:putative transposase